MHFNNGSTCTFNLLLFEGLGSRSQGCKGLPYGDMDQTLFIDDEPSKVFQNPKWNELFLEPFRGCRLSKNKVQ